jgi:hypothetical protein
VPHGIDAAVENSKPPKLKPVSNDILRKTGIEELRPPDDTVLSIGEARQPPLPPTQLELTVTIPVKSS